jgi:hypothetical protein
MAARVELKKKSLLVSLKGFDAKTIRLGVKTASRKFILTFDFEELTVGREPPFREDLSAEEGVGGLAIVKCRYQATTSEDIEGWKRLCVIL